MPPQHWMLAALATPTSTRVPEAISPIDAGITTIESVPGDIAAIPVIQHLSDLMPAADLLLGAAMLIAIVLMHAAGIRVVTNRVVRKSVAIAARPRMWRADLLMGTTVGLLLTLHIGEIFLWSASLVYSGIVSDWHAAGFFAGNTYTTLGYGRFILPKQWEMLAPIIAISGLFTFGWSGSVLVDLIARCQKIKEAAHNSHR